jgi:2-polyprenyl-3-methyl-5-hydroxy-6-metoxy-1,4-benzoquinol methylase
LNFNKANSSLFLRCKDHCISGEEFELLHNSNYDLLRTNPVPANLNAYYESEAYISHTDRKRSIFEIIYYLVKNYTLRKKLSYIEKYHPEKGLLLDIGAGTGDFLKKAQERGWETVGIEPNLNARKRAIDKGIALQADLENLPPNKYKVITLWHVFEHIEDINNEINRLKESLAENGTLIIAVPNFRSYDAKHYRNYWAAYDVPRHIWHFSRTAIEKIFNSHQMELVNVIPMKFDAYYVSLLSEKYKTGFMNPFKAFYVASISNWKARSSKEHSSHIYVLKNNQ